MEKSKVGPQQPELRKRDILNWIRGHAAAFSKQGAVAETWHRRGEQRHGPYFRLRWREGGRRRSLHLGTSPELADEIRGLLGKLQKPLRERLLLRRLRIAAARELRRHRASWHKKLAAWKLWGKGAEVRGWSRVSRVRIAYALLRSRMGLDKDDGLDVSSAGQ